MVRRYGLGGIASLAAVLGGALAAEAQGIDIKGTGPLAVYHTDSQSTYTCTVTFTGSHYFKLWVYRNGIQKYMSSTLMYSNPGTLDISHNVGNMNTWGMVPGDQLKYRGRVWTGLLVDIDEWFVTVQEGITRLERRKDPFPAQAPDREPLLATVVRREEKDWA